MRTNSQRLCEKDAVELAAFDCCAISPGNVAPSVQELAARRLDSRHLIGDNATRGSTAATGLANR
jgi:hypothetical protein